MSVWQIDEMQLLQVLSVCVAAAVGWMCLLGQDTMYRSAAVQYNLHPGQQLYARYLCLFVCPF